MKVVIGKGVELHGVFKQTGTGSKTGFGKAGGARIILRHGVINLIEIGAVHFADHVELIGSGELDVTPGVGEELGEFGLDAAGDDDLAGEIAEEIGDLISGIFVVTGDDLRQLVELFHGLAFQDALARKTDLDTGDALLQPATEVAGGSGKDGAAQNQNLILVQIFADGTEEAPEIFVNGVQMGVDRGADDDDNKLCVADATGGGAGEEGFMDAAIEKFFATTLHEGHLAGINQLASFFIDVVDDNVLTLGCKCYR